MAATHDPGATMLQENPDAALRVFQGGAISIDGIAGIQLSADLTPLLSGETVTSIYSISEDDNWFERTATILKKTLGYLGGVRPSAPANTQPVPGEVADAAGVKVEEKK